MAWFQINDNYIIVEFQRYIRKVIVLAVSRELCVFHVDGMSTATRGEGIKLVDACEQREGVKIPIFCGRHKKMTP